MSGEDSLAGLAGEIEEEFEIVEGEELSSEDLTGLEEVTEVSEGVGARNHGRELRSRVDPLFFGGVFFIGDFDITSGRVGNSMSSETGWEDTVEHINPSIDSLDEVLGSSESHEIVRFG